MIGFIGSGSMAGAIVRGAVASGSVPAREILLSSATGDTARALAQETGAAAVPGEDATARNLELVREAGPGGLVVLAVKPRLVGEVLAPLREDLAGLGSVVVSLAAGLELVSLAELTAPGQPLVRAMPNVNALVGAGMTAVCANGAVRAEQLEEVVALFSAVGETAVLAERLFPAYTAIAGSAPAWTGLYVEALARGAVANGMPKAQAVGIATQMLVGSARTMASGVTPTELADMVSSPGGTTVAGTVALEDAGFSPAVVRAVQAAVDRA